MWIRTGLITAVKHPLSSVVVSLLLQVRRDHFPACVTVSFKGFDILKRPVLHHVHMNVGTSGAQRIHELHPCKFSGFVEFERLWDWFRSHRRLQTSAFFDFDKHPESFYKPFLLQSVTKAIYEQRQVRGYLSPAVCCGLSAGS